ncbi:MAG: hypothetical protein H7263_08715 [Candidatus Sericytochromatia bacterium]|nr:hypothetical protein [Candidatus Sericytochromatia bacterium]
MTIQENSFIYKEKSFTEYQLGKLQEIISKVDCECPNQVAALVSSLYAFEDYSKKCENKNDKDAEIHKLLYEKTSQARVIMEEALKKICDFENINV